MIEDLNQFDQDVSEDDSDKELQVAFQKGLLKGLVYETQAPPRYINNKIGLKESLENFKVDLPWIERLDITTDPLRIPKPIEEELNDTSGDNVDDDFKRENLFYRQSQAALLEGIKRLHSMKIPTKRPEDYFAEMLKSDSHMKRIKENLLSLQMAKERSEKAKKLREMKKYGKEVQKNVQEKRRKEKKEMLDTINRYKKGKKADLDFLNDKKTLTKKENKMPNKRRVDKNKKFGFGGQKKRSKFNNKESNDDFKFAGNPKKNSKNKEKKTFKKTFVEKKYTNKNKSKKHFGRKNK